MRRDKTPFSGNWPGLKVLVFAGTARTSPVTAAWIGGGGAGGVTEEGVTVTWSQHGGRL